MCKRFSQAELESHGLSIYDMRFDRAPETHHQGACLLASDLKLHGGGSGRLLKREAILNLRLSAYRLRHLQLLTRRTNN